jgi:hypothetical protein
MTSNLDQRMACKALLESPSMLRKELVNVRIPINKQNNVLS